MIDRLPPTQSPLAQFADRHIGPAPDDVDTMLDVLGFSSLADLISAAVPDAIRSSTPLDLPEAMSETEAMAAMRAMADRNTPFTSLIGMGYHGTITPPVVLRNVLESPSWYTAYTPYQPEISQGRLEALLNYQTMVIDLTGMEIANSSLLDEATAAAEAMTAAVSHFHAGAPRQCAQRIRTITERGKGSLSAAGPRGARD